MSLFNGEETSIPPTVSMLTASWNSSVHCPVREL
jgi:hypothetical protein